jgi:hypothetical protein
MPKQSPVIVQQEIERAIILRRGEQVLLDSDLARFYGVTTSALNQAVSRNIDRFPADFLFRLTAQELTDWRSQVVTSNPGAKMGLRRAPYAFTEHGVAMLASVLRSERAVQVNIEIVRSFVRLRRVIAANADLAKRLDEVEKRLGDHDEQFVQVIRAIRELMQPPVPAKRRRIGFYQPTDDGSSSSNARRRK